jgi:hypothetical protein
MHIYVPRSNETTCLIDTFIWHPPLSENEYDKIFFYYNKEEKKKLNLKLVSKLDVDTHNVFRCVKFESQDWENVLGSKRLLLKSLHVANNHSMVCLKKPWNSLVRLKS